MDKKVSAYTEEMAESMQAREIGSVSNKMSRSIQKNFPRKKTRSINTAKVFWKRTSEQTPSNFS